MDNDKTIIIYPGNDTSDMTKINDTVFAFPDKPRNLVDPNSEFLDTYKNQPFISCLRALYSEIVPVLTGDKSIKNLEEFRNKLISIMDYQMQLLSEHGYENSHIMIVRYILSTFIDENLNSVGFSNSDTWANHSLLSYYYKETYGGEKFFILLDHFMREPARYINHLKLVYVTLSLGYMGKYSLVENGTVNIENIRKNLIDRIKLYDRENKKFYEPHPTSKIKHKLIFNVPYKLFIASWFILIAAIYFVFTGMVSENEKGLMETLDKSSLVATNGSNNGE